MAKTLVISDLHLGSSAGADLLRHRRFRERILDLLVDIDRLVILGDCLELRESALRDAVQASVSFFTDIGKALGPDSEILLVPGNHDYGMVAGWIDVRLQTQRPGFLQLEHYIEPSSANGVAATLSEFARPSQLQLVYPGVWLRDDIYAFHGHYLDVHTTVPTFERLAAGAMAKWAVSLPVHGATSDDYEAVLSPLYAWIHALVQRSDHTLMSAGASASARAWVSIAGDGRKEKPLRAATFGLGVAAGIGLINAIGVGPVSPRLSGPALRKGSLIGIAEVLRRMEIRAKYVVFGHSHRSGPWPHDDLSEWITNAGTRLVNTGSWVNQPHFLAGQASGSPYWPGTAVLIDGDKPPEILHLLLDCELEDFSPARLFD